VAALGGLGLSKVRERATIKITRLEEKKFFARACARPQSGTVALYADGKGMRNPLQDNKTAVFEGVRRGRIPRKFQTDLTENRANSAKQSQF
jgi:hypothetical protein